MTCRLRTAVRAVSAPIRATADMIVFVEEGKGSNLSHTISFVTILFQKFRSRNIELTLTCRILHKLNLNLRGCALNLPAPADAMMVTPVKISFLHSSNVLNMMLKIRVETPRYFIILRSEALAASICGSRN